jgi:hypothetical protein
MSAKTPAGGVKRKNGRDATVDISESKNVDEPSMFIVQVAAVSCAATHVPESKTANQSFRYNGFRSAAKVEVLLGLSFTGVVTETTLELLKNQNRLHLGGRNCRQAQSEIIPHCLSGLSAGVRSLTWVSTYLVSQDLFLHQLSGPS